HPATPSAGGRVLVLHDLEGPQLALLADRPLRAVLVVPLAEGGAAHPGLEVLFGGPARVHEEHVPVVGGPHELEGLEARGSRHCAGTGGETLHQLVVTFLRHRDGIDLDDTHRGLLSGSAWWRRSSTGRDPGDASPEPVPNAPEVSLRSARGVE